MLLLLLNFRVDSDSSSCPTPVALDNQLVSPNIAPVVIRNTQPNNNEVPAATTTHTPTMSGAMYAPSTSFATNVQSTMGHTYPNATPGYNQHTVGPFNHHTGGPPNNTWSQAHGP